MRVALVALALLVAASAGCLAKNDGKETASVAGATGAASKSATSSVGTSTKTGTGSKSGTSTGPAQANTAELTVDVVNGTAPLTVNFTITATGGPSSWTLAFGDGDQGNGTTVPTTVNHTYTALGLLQANLTVSYPDGATLARNVTLNITGGGGEVLVASVPFSADGLILVGTQGDGEVAFEGCGFTNTEDLDVVLHSWDLGATVIGSGAVVTKFVVHMDLGDSNVDTDIYLVDAAGAEVGSSADFNVLSGSPTEDFEVTGAFLPGTYTFEVRGCTTVAGEYSITATASIGTA